jgi:hypothetical protein
VKGTEEAEAEMERVGEAEGETAEAEGATEREEEGEKGQLQCTSSRWPRVEVASSTQGTDGS